MSDTPVVDDDTFEDGEEILIKIDAYRGAMIEVIPEERKRKMDEFLCDFVYFLDRLTKAGVVNMDDIVTLYSIYRKDNRLPHESRDRISTPRKKEAKRKPSESQIKYAKYLYDMFKPEGVDIEAILEDEKQTRTFIQKYHRMRKNANKEG